MTCGNAFFGPAPALGRAHSGRAFFGAHPADSRGYEPLAAPDLLAAADYLIGRDIPVFPWQRWPDASIGIPTGAASGVDVVVVDVHSTGTGFQPSSRLALPGSLEAASGFLRKRPLAWFLPL